MVTLRQILEAVLFSSAKPLPLASFREILKSAANALPEDEHAKALAKLKDDEIQKELETLRDSFIDADRGFDLIENAGGWQVVSHPACGLWVRQLFPEMKPARLSPPALETLAIIAYRQPLTRADIEAVRGVAVDGVMQTLLDRGLVKIAGRADVPGRPLLYETTQFFMEHFGLKTLEELPNSQELRRIPLPQAPPPEETESTQEESAKESGEPASEAVGEANEELPSESPGPDSDPMVESGTAETPPESEEISESAEPVATEEEDPAPTA